MRSQIPTGSSFGEIYTVRALPGQMRGGHFHKLTSEFFFVLEGKVSLHLQDYNGTRTTLMLDMEAPQRVFVPPYIWHQFENSGSKDALILAAADKEFEPDNPDTYSSPPDGEQVAG